MEAKLDKAENDARIQAGNDLPSLPDFPLQDTDLLKLKLLAAEERYLTLAGVSKQIIWNTDTEGNIMNDVPLWRMYTGQTRKEAQGFGWMDAIHPGDQEYFQHAWAKAIESKSLLEVEIRLRHYNGIYNYVIARAYPVFDESGKNINEWIGCCVDINKQKMAEQRLRLQNAVSKVLIQSSQLDEVSDNFLKAIGDGMGWEVGALWLVDKDSGVLRCIRIWHAPLVHSEAYEDASWPITLTPGTGLPGRVWQIRKPIWYENILTESNVIHRMMALAQEGLHSAIAFPIHGISGFLGAVEFFSREMRPAETDLLEMVENLGNQLGQFIEKMRAIEANRVEEARKSAMLEASLDCIITIDHDGYILEFNPAAEKVFGYTYEEAIGKKMAELIIPDSLREQHYKGVMHYLATGEGSFINQRVETVAMRKDGTEFPVDLAIIRVPVVGPPIFTGYIRDITERKESEQRTEQALNALLEMAEAMVDVPLEDSLDEEKFATTSTSITHKLADLARSVLGCRRIAVISFERASAVMQVVAVSGLTPIEEDLVKRNVGDELGWTNAYGKEFLDKLLLGQPFIIDLIDSGTRGIVNPYDASKVLIAPMHIGTRFVGFLALDHGKIPHEYDERELALTAAVARFIALILEHEQLLSDYSNARSNEDLLRKANQMMDEFLSMVSHELRTPLTVNLGALDLAKAQLKSIHGLEVIGVPQFAGKVAQALKCIESAEQQGGMINRLVSDLLDNARIRNGKLKMHKVKCNLAEVIKKSILEIKHLNPERAIRFENTEESVLVRADTDRIVQVMNNFITNALKYSPDDKPLEITVDVIDNIAQVSVHDYGQGLTKEEQEMIWMRFQQTERVNAQHDLGGGLGLGLYISRSIIEQHEGQIGVESSLGKGTTFWFKLPVIPTSPPCSSV